MFHGSMVAIVTPMNDDGSIDFDALKSLTQWHVEQGTHAIVAAGTTGESATLSDVEKIQVIKTVVDTVNERIPVIAGTAHCSTADTIHLTQLAMQVGADAALVMTPPYIKPTQQGLFLHYKTLAEHVALPIIIYNVPSRTASDILPETVADLSRLSNIVGIKEATGDVVRAQAILQSCEGIDVYCGDDASNKALLQAGAKGVISVTSNIAPKLMSELCEAALKGDAAEVARLDALLMPLHQAIALETNPIPVKYALHRMGKIQQYLRLPMTELSEAGQTKMNEVLTNFNL